MARAFAKPRALDQLLDVLRWAADEGISTAAVGLGSNLLAADEGVDARREAGG